MRNVCRWGILGAAGIARKNWAAIRNSGNSQLVAVASREASRAAQFINELQLDCPHPTVPVPCSYEELLSRNDIDAVYIPLPTGLRAEWVIKAARAGKHVLCEKPCATSVGELREMLEACKANGVQFMDGVMFIHSSRLPAIRNALDDGESIGTLKRIVGQFSFLPPDDFFQGNIRVSRQMEPHGALGDLGWYLIRFALWTMKLQMPVEVNARMLSQHGSADAAVPTEVSAEMLFEGGVSASFYCSFLTDHQQFVHVSGTKGNLMVNDFVLPHFGNETAFTVSQSVFDIQGTRFNMQNYPRRVAVRELSNNGVDAQETNLFRTFSQLVNEGRIDPYWPDISMKTQIVLDACLESARNDARPVRISNPENR
ncbi:Gfo/Idh/MocA family protein [Planctomicrobium sp. SH661]|uniref:Gfo/Idh/MocA family protein n=1 Tax=Planctomicrobium sp. SH661 TaxID=3448124 RepID=UPI003F5CB2B9